MSFPSSIDETYSTVACSYFFCLEIQLMCRNRSYLFVNRIAYYLFYDAVASIVFIIHHHQKHDVVVDGGEKVVARGA